MLIAISHWRAVEGKVGFIAFEKLFIGLDRKEVA